ncbi:hypothetical protein [uncultured Amnibacterium sp.]|uniref:hypothetical protein n=1 Tax=uncultured Amnibacterium sp. TaxID=1631851 RepID=UPI0035C96B71
MDDIEFDDLLRRAGATTAVRAETLDELVDRTRARRRTAHRRKPVLIGLAVTGAVLLAAAATSDYWTKISPFQSLETGMYRTPTAIPVDYVTTSGVHEHCQAFLEYLDLSVQQSEQAEAYVEQHDWTGLGQRTYDAVDEADVSDALDPVMNAAAAAAVPSAAPKGSGGDHARISGWSMVCAETSK